MRVPYLTGLLSLIPAVSAVNTLGKPAMHLEFICREYICLTPSPSGPWVCPISRSNSSQRRQPVAQPALRRAIHPTAAVQCCSAALGRDHSSRCHQGGRSVPLRKQPGGISVRQPPAVHGGGLLIRSRVCAGQCDRDEHATDCDVYLWWWLYEQLERKLQWHGACGGKRYEYDRREGELSCRNSWIRRRDSD